jgi:hypothetical protein
MRLIAHFALSWLVSNKNEQPCGKPQGIDSEKIRAD